MCPLMFKFTLKQRRVGKPHLGTNDVFLLLTPNTDGSRFAMVRLDIFELHDGMKAIHV